MSERIYGHDTWIAVGNFVHTAVVGGEFVNKAMDSVNSGRRIVPTDEELQLLGKAQDWALVNDPHYLLYPKDVTRLNAEEIGKLHALFVMHSLDGDLADMLGTPEDRPSIVKLLSMVSSVTAPALQMSLEE